jgi:hypothetical protein
MAVATTVARNEFNRGLYGTANLLLASGTGVSAGTVLTIAGDTTVLAIRELPFTQWACEITATNRGNARMIFRVGDTVTG